MVLPKLQGIPPRYEQKQFDATARRNKLQIIVSPSGKDGSTQINQDAFLSLADIDAGHSLNYKMADSAKGYVFFS